jgi:hypothetical protein
MKVWAGLGEGKLVMVNVLETDVEEASEQAGTHDCSVRQQLKGNEAFLGEELLPDWEDDDA